MELTQQQKQAVCEWVAAGASLSDVQKNLKAEFKLTLTYMDVRLLVLEAGAAVKDKPEPKPAKPLAPPPVPQDEAVLEEEEVETTPYPEEEPSGEAPSGDEPPASSVTMTLDSLVVPGAMVSGNVVFSDGAKARWIIDQYGRFGLEPDVPGYRPAPADLQAFQMQLRTALQRKGYV